MTVNELIEALQKLAADGHGNWSVYAPGEGYVWNVNLPADGALGIVYVEN